MSYAQGRVAPIALALLLIAACIQAGPIPAVHKGISVAPGGDTIYITAEGDTLPLLTTRRHFTAEQMRAVPVGNDEGVLFDFGEPRFNGRLYYGFIPDTDETDYPLPIYFNRYALIDSGRAEVPIGKYMVGKYDIVDWQEEGHLHLGYRVATESGQLLYDGRLRVRAGEVFAADTSIVEGPFVHLLTDSSAVISYRTNFPTISEVHCDARIFSESAPGRHHEVQLFGLQPDSDYEYRVVAGPYSETYSFHTAPRPGSRKPFTFAYASDGRGNNGGGERDLRGVNAYILKKIGALARYKEARFLQFTGDMIDGYTSSLGRIELEYANWKRTIEPFAHYLPVVAGFGNHEVLLHVFSDNENGRIRINKFPYDSLSSEVVFARNFVNPVNGPASEDGAVYDPDPDATDFPPYDETVFYYTYDNVAMIVLNSNYWFAPSIRSRPHSGGNLHGYIMDNQLVWLEETLGMLESDDNIDHIFVTLHTPIFPNGGHVKDDMWYSGSNEPRPTVAGEPVETGIIERRDQLLDLLMNHSTKVKATLTGDEHNYSLLRVSPGMQMYPDDWDGPRLTNIRPLRHINNGAAGAPYYGRESTPWEDHLEAFSTQNALVFFHVNGETIRCEVINPDTMELIDEFEL